MSGGDLSTCKSAHFCNVSCNRTTMICRRKLLQIRRVANEDGGGMCKPVRRLKLSFSTTKVQEADSSNASVAHKPPYKDAKVCISRFEGSARGCTKSGGKTTSFDVERSCALLQ